MAKGQEVILSVKNLKQHFHVGRNKIVKAVDDVSFDIYKGEVFGLVGESGSGKSTTGRSIIRLYKPTDGDIIYKGKDISKKLSKEDKKHIANEIQMIFQDPMACLNPRMTVRAIIAEGLDIHFKDMSEEEKTEKVHEVLEIVGLTAEHANRYPHEFSGGQRQRIGIARSIIMNPSFIIADEPISALDVSIQAQVVNLMIRLKDTLGLTYLFIAHDLSMVHYISDRIAVMHLGKIVELGDTNHIFDEPIHPYTKSLLSAIPMADPLYEKANKRIYYDKSKVDYYAGEFREVSPGHFVLATDAEMKEWTK